MAATTTTEQGIQAIVRTAGTKKGPITVEEAKALVGWSEESQGEFGDDFKLRTLEGKKVRLNKCLTNRPFRVMLAKRYALEMLRRTWRLNGEPQIIDKHGMVQDGQHRLVGLIYAEMLRQRNPKHWKQYGITEPMTMESVIISGIDPAPETVDTLDTGQGRSFGDVIFRRHAFSGPGESGEMTQKRLSNTLAVATRLVWLRAGGKVVSDAPHFPISEATDFLKSHPKILDACRVVTALDGTGADGRQIRSKISLGYAAGLFYLQAAAKSDPENGKVDLGLWDKATDFWKRLAEGAGLDKGDPVLALRNSLGRIEKGSGGGRDEAVGLIVNAWNLFVDGKKGDGKAIAVKKTNENGKRVIEEHPRIGGLDREVEPPPKEPEPKAEKPAKGKGDGKKTPNWKMGKKVRVKNPEEGDWTGVPVRWEGDLVVVKADEDGEHYLCDPKHVSALKDKGKKAKKVKVKAKAKAEESDEEEEGE